MQVECECVCVCVCACVYNTLHGFLTPKTIYVHAGFHSVKLDVIIWSDYKDV